MVPSNNSFGSLLINTQSSTTKTTSASKRIHKNSWMKPKKNGKIRVKLAPIESYQKELEFSQVSNKNKAEAPARVVVRLERLMGTDKIRIMDPRYMHTLFEKLQQEEEAHWLKRTRNRKQAERSRFRRLAVEGLMKPTPDMHDLYNHPVFRINRILNRLTKIDHSIIGATDRLPPIIPVEPFLDDDNGRYKYRPVNVNHLHDEGDAETTDNEDSKCQPQHSSKSQPPPPVLLDEDQEQEWGGEDYVHSKLETYCTNKNDPLSAVMARYGIPKGTNIEKKCHHYHSPLVDLVFDENLGEAKQMFETAQKVSGAYKREQATSEEFTIKLNKLL